MAKSLPPLKAAKGKSPKAANPAGKSVAETIGLKIGKAIGKKLRTAAVKKGKELIQRVIKGRPADEPRSKPTRAERRDAAAELGSMGRGHAHNITDAYRRTLSRRLAGARKVWQSMPPSKRRHRNTKALS